MMQMQDMIIRDIKPDEIESIASMISDGYYNDVFFKWSVPSDADRHKIVADYYKIYLSVPGCVAHVAECSAMGIVGASVWLPHDVDVSIYDDIDKAAGVYAPQFRAVADWSHYSEPPMTPFYQLVGFVVPPQMQGTGIGGVLLKHHLDKLDKLGIPTYLEASTPYFGGGVYGRFGYQPVGELMVFAQDAVLYPLWRAAKQSIKFGGYDWRILEKYNGKMLLLSEKAIVSQPFHDTFEDVAWESSSIRKYLNGVFLASLPQEERSKIVDEIFLLSIDEVLKYFGKSGSGGKFFIDDEYNHVRKAVCLDGSLSKWILRTPGNQSGFIANVTVDGRISVTGDFVNRKSTPLFNVGVRPALWVTAD